MDSDDLHGNRSSILHIMEVLLNVIQRIQELIRLESSKLDAATVDEIEAYLEDLQKLLNSSIFQARSESLMERPWTEDEAAIRASWEALNQKVQAR